MKFEEVLVSLPPVGKLKELEQYAYEGKDFGAFDDTDKAVGRKAISILFSGRPLAVFFLPKLFFLSALPPMAVFSFPSVLLVSAW